VAVSAIPSGPAKEDMKPAEQYWGSYGAYPSWGGYSSWPSSSWADMVDTTTDKQFLS